jgi:subfamily B ATP-binding cassette protein MsbA
MKEFLQVLRRFVPPYKKYLVLSVVFNILSAVLNIFSFAALIPILQILFQTGDAEAATELMAWDWGNAQGVLMNNLNYTVNGLISDFGPTTTLLFIGLFLAVTTFLKTGAYFLTSACIVPIRTGVVRDIRNQLYRKITSLPLGFFSEERKGDIIARMSGDVQEVENSIMSSLEMLFKNPVLILAYFATLVFISWQLTLFTLVIVPVMGWFMGLVGRKLKAQSVKAQALWSDTMSQVEETLGGLRIIKAFCAEQKMNQRFDRINSSYRDDLMKVNIRQSSAHPMSEFLGTVMIVIVLWFGGVLVLNNQSITGPTFIYYMVILYSIINPLKEFSKAGYNIPKGLASMERIDKILLAENTIKEPSRPRRLKSFEHQIEFRNVWFGYRANGANEANASDVEADINWVLKGINLTIHKGQTIAIVGQSGSGKSTLVDLIPRYYDVQEGEVLIDGINVKDLGIYDLRQLIGNVNQEAILFNDSFRNNIAFGISENLDNQDNPGDLQKRIEEASKIANAYDFIMQSEQGFDTNIGDRGGRLSGGQRQRVSIARAILKNPPILILDEATSALDTESERLVQDALERLMKTRTTVAIAHRLSTIKNADEICVLHEGRIVERGTHDELLSFDGYYKKLNDMQSL